MTGVDEVAKDFTCPSFAILSLGPFFLLILCLCCHPQHLSYPRPLDSLPFLPFPVLRDSVRFAIEDAVRV